MKPTVGLTIGDYNGIGAEVALKSAVHPSVRRICEPVLIGAHDAFAYYAKRLHLVGELRRTPVLEVIRGGRLRPTPGRVSKDAGTCAGRAIEEAVRRCRLGEIHAIVTAPVSKEGLNLAGYSYPGQTELLQNLTRSPAVAMMFVSHRIKVGLATIHVPLKKVARLISRRLIIEKLAVIHEALKTDLCIRNPQIALMGLNPHAGEHGLIGIEEERILKPALRSARAAGIRVAGPFSADSFFGVHRNRYDAILAMYHDQGLIPVKLLAMERAVNYTAGLSIIRTSPAHGVAYDIAGKGIANPSGMIEAIRWAVRIFQNRGRRRSSGSSLSHKDQSHD